MTRQQKGETMPKGEPLTAFSKEAVGLASYLLAVNPPFWDYKQIRERAQQVLESGQPTASAERTAMNIATHLMAQNMLDVPVATAVPVIAQALQSVPSSPPTPICETHKVAGCRECFLGPPNWAELPEPSSPPPRPCEEEQD